MRYYITTPIYYVNGEPHLGHAYTTIAADVLARYHRQKGDDVFFLTGVGRARQQGRPGRGRARPHAAAARRRAGAAVPRARARSSTPPTTSSSAPPTRSTRPSCSSSWRSIKAAGDIEKRTYGGLYCTACEGFWYERDLADGTCPDHGIEPVWLEEENYYFLLSKYQDRLAEFFRANPDFVKPRSRYNEALSFIEQGLDDISISRSSITWGVPVPWDPEQVIYVWVDALINYLSALTYARPGEDLVERYWPAASCTSWPRTSSSSTPSSGRPC